ncbi:hypothetical protein IGI04_006777 [Brassica rapa subsp. trilocularis]|uniref:Uncharacterized protein n=1 Tax=Brassica rapa subsp. trilocularis TaxID=1813537 RepID=A0ABQ7NI87_BRACM|nr:hypothetical protein IGI04_006777 [Brassica rapa subsp. trilocularis]
MRETNLTLNLLIYGSTITTQLQEHGVLVDLLIFVSKRNITIGPRMKVVVMAMSKEQESSHMTCEGEELVLE